jgi:hypothetical protein
MKFAVTDGRRSSRRSTCHLDCTGSFGTWLKSCSFYWMLFPVMTHFTHVPSPVSWMYVWEFHDSDLKSWCSWKFPREDHEVHTKQYWLRTGSETMIVCLSESSVLSAGACRDKTHVQVFSGFKDLQLKMESLMWEVPSHSEDKWEHLALHCPVLTPEIFPESILVADVEFQALDLSQCGQCTLWTLQHTIYCWRYSLTHTYFV